MAGDAGARADPDAPLQGASSVTEIELEDPVNAGRGWVYLATYRTNPPPRCPLPDYVRYNYDTDCDYSWYERADGTKVCPNYQELLNEGVPNIPPTRSSNILSPFYLLLLKQ